MAHHGSDPKAAAGRDRRLECRYGANTECSVCVLGDEEHTRQTAYAVDVSQHGAMLQCTKRLPMRAAVKMEIADYAAVGRVQRVTGIFTGFFRRRYLVGIKLKRPWPEEVFRQLAFPDAHFTGTKQVAEDDDYFERMVH